MHTEGYSCWRLCPQRMQLSAGGWARKKNLVHTPPLKFGRDREQKV